MLEKIQPQETLTIYQRTNLEKKSSGKKKKLCLPNEYLYCSWWRIQQVVSDQPQNWQTQKIVMYLLGATDIFRMMLELPYWLVTYLTTEIKLILKMQ